MIEYIFGGCVVLGVLEALAGDSTGADSGQDYSPSSAYDVNQGQSNSTWTYTSPSYDGPREFTNVP